MSEIKTQPSQTLVMRRVFDAPRERVFAAWTKPESLRQIMSPGEMKAIDVVQDFRVGGAWKVTMQPPEGESFYVKGIYRDIVAPERLVCTWQWEEDDPKDELETLVTLEFHERGPKTEVVLKHERLRDAESRARHEHGWSDAFDNLARIA